MMTRTIRHSESKSLVTFTFTTAKERTDFLTACRKYSVQLPVTAGWRQGKKYLFELDARQAAKLPQCYRGVNYPSSINPK